MSALSKVEMSVLCDDLLSPLFNILNIGFGGVDVAALGEV